MQKTIFLVALLIATSFSIFGQTTDTKSSKMSKTEQEVADLVTEFANALVKRDTDTIERLLADDFMEITLNGNMTSKSQYVANYKKPLSPTAGKLEAFESSDLKIRVYGDAAVMSFRLKARGQNSKGEAFNQDLGMWTAVLAKIKGKWQIVSTQGSPIPPPKPATTPTN
jgi:ketosteroid isomerase-like protein